MDSRPDNVVQDQADRLAWFKSVILPHEAALRKRIRRLASTPDVDVDDIVSEVLVRAYTTSDYQRIDRGRTFLFTIARNLLTDLARRRAIVSFELMASLESLDAAGEAPSAETIVSAREELHQLQKVTETMPPQCRRVFLLRRVEALPFAEIADRLGLSVSTVEKHLARAIDILTRGMAESDPAPRKRTGLEWRSVKERR